MPLLCYQITLLCLTSDWTCVCSVWGGELYADFITNFRLIAMAYFLSDLMALITTWRRGYAYIITSGSVGRKYKTFVAELIWTEKFRQGVPHYLKFTLTRQNLSGFWAFARRHCILRKSLSTLTLDFMHYIWGGDVREKRKSHPSPL